MTEIKICGIKYDEDIKIINQFKPDYVGMVLFFEKSRRNISIDRAEEIIKLIDKSIKKTAVVVSPDMEQIRAIEKAGFDYIQIHKSLPENILEKIQIPVIRAVNIPDEDEKADAAAYNEIENLIKNDKIYGILFDAKIPGSGKTFRWRNIDNIKNNIKNSDKKLFLAGGINPDNAESAIEQVNPDVIDVSSGVEKDDGAGKDKKKTEKLIKKIREKK